MFVKNIDKGTTEKELRLLFEEFGPLAKCKMNKDKKGMRIGTAYVEYDNPVDAV